ncbi:MAG: hypothetical protein JO010_06795, partial [Alphaproteobacteria bacterium]|nr:hypothetical protein [Alphaproteobacteria bacterium]
MRAAEPAYIAILRLETRLQHNPLRAAWGHRAALTAAALASRLDGRGVDVDRLMAALIDAPVGLIRDYGDTQHALRLLHTWQTIDRGGAERGGDDPFAAPIEAAIAEMTAAAARHLRCSLRGAARLLDELRVAGILR